MAVRDKKKQVRMQERMNRLDGTSPAAPSAAASRGGSPGDAKGGASGDDGARVDVARGLGDLAADTLEALEAEVRASTSKGR